MALFKLNKGFNKMSLSEQESVLVKKLQEVYLIEEQITKALAKVRGGHRYEAREIERPDEAILKS